MPSLHTTGTQDDEDEDAEAIDDGGFEWEVEQTIPEVQHMRSTSPCVCWLVVTAFDLFSHHCWKHPTAMALTISIAIASLAFSTTGAQ